jgi:hypothetical protein
MSNNGFIITHYVPTQPGDAHAASSGAWQLRVPCSRLTRQPAPGGRVVVGPVARCRSGHCPPAATAGPQQPETHVSRAGSGSGGDVHPPAGRGRPVVVTDSVGARLR